MLLRNSSGVFPRIEHVNISNPSKCAQDNAIPGFKPEVIFYAKWEENKNPIGTELVIDERTYRKDQGFKDYSLYYPMNKSSYENRAG